MPSATSTKNKIVVHSSTAICTCFLISDSNTSSLPLMYPPVSTTENSTPFQFVFP